MPTNRINAVNTIERLQQRIDCNQSSSRSFAEFVITVLRPQADDIALDIGPGLGSQLIPLAARVRRIVGLDLSAEMVAELQARTAGAAAEILRGDMDDLGNIVPSGPFSLIYAVYSLYYSHAPASVVRQVAALLASERGRFVCINPDAGNNQGWFADLGALYDLPADVVGVPHIGQRVILPAFREAFAAVECFSYEDRKRFLTLESLMAYYDACAPYCRPDTRDEAARFFGEKIEREGGYEIAKRSLAIVGMGPKPPRKEPSLTPRQASGAAPRSDHRPHGARSRTARESRRPE
jgi:SAM-dependent methyltransferase